jgi:uncharacterized protein (TIGR02001 family)
MHTNFVTAGGCILAFALVGSAHAEDSGNTVTANIGIYSQYVFRGLTQTDRHPAVQGGFDYAHASGFYAGTWLSNISWFTDTNPGNSASLEWDLYGGFKKTWTLGISTDVGYIRYEYPGTYSSLPLGIVEPNTNEAYAAVGWKWLNLKYSYAFSDLFGVEDSKGSDYLDFTVSVPLNARLALAAHAGRQHYTGFSTAARLIGASNDALFTYNDYRVSLTYTLPQGWSTAATFTNSTARDTGYTVLGSNLGDDQLVVSVTRSL